MGRYLGGLTGFDPFLNIKGVGWYGKWAKMKRGGLGFVLDWIVFGFGL